MRDLSLGQGMHIAVATATLGGSAIGAIASETLDEDLPIDVYTWVVPVVAVVLGGLAAWTWRARRWPFTTDDLDGYAVSRLLCAALAGTGIGSYCVLFFEFWHPTSVQVSLSLLFPMSVASCAGAGFVRGALRLTALHVGTELGAQSALLAAEGHLHEADELMRAHGVIVLQTLVMLVVAELVVRALRRRYSLRRPPAPDATGSAPRRAR